jgi:hypothetical protein
MQSFMQSSSFNNLIKKMEKERMNKTICPFVKEPNKDCYCFKLDSQSIKAVIYYCSKNFEECAIYNKLFVMEQLREAQPNLSQ